MAPLCKLSEAVSSAHCKEPNSAPFRENSSSPVIPIEYKPFNDSEGLQRGITSASLLTELSGDPNCYHSLEDILRTVRQLQKNDAQKNEEILWLRRRLDSLTKDIY